jgi:hypothetical protein
MADERQDKDKEPHKQHSAQPGCEPPRLEVLGTLAELTEGDLGATTDGISPAS